MEEERSLGQGGHSLWSPHDWAAFSSHPLPHEGLFVQICCLWMAMAVCARPGRRQCWDHTQRGPGAEPASVSSALMGQPQECGEVPPLRTPCAARDRPTVPPADYCVELQFSGEVLALFQPENLLTVSPGYPQTMPLLCPEVMDINN